ncbi:unnamed protein product [Periconia digitata]|uniref:F-box domain-containing protein n=1 Tax=Periconia digitata TaxID=1303443 RepID=A0A9W4U6U6_9PLEO|nr:unnamed protein product [Periconia digitata]
MIKRPKRPRRPTIFERLPEELRQCLVPYCDSTTIFNLCITSKATYNACIGLLYFHIDLSCHNATDLRRHNFHSVLDVTLDHLHASQTDAERRLLLRQSKFSDLVLENPQLVSHTRSFKWTCLSTDQWYVPGSPEHVPSYARLNYGSDQLWTTFSCFTAVNEIDLAFLTGKPDTSIPPPSLFPTATSLSLTGMPTSATLSSIFSSITPSKLKHLRLNNLHSIPTTPTTHHVGFALGHLSSLTNRCTSLQSFHYHSTAEYFPGSAPHHQHHPTLWQQIMQKETLRFTELAAFIESVKFTLRDFFFEHGPDIDYVGSSVSAQQRQNNPLPMDQLFDAHLRPVISTGPWPQLRRFRLLGIGYRDPMFVTTSWLEEGSQNDVHVYRDDVKMLLDAMPGVCEIAVSDKAGRPFYNHVVSGKFLVLGM